jgi:hypothetical protein
MKQENKKKRKELREKQKESKKNERGDVSLCFNFDLCHRDRKTRSYQTIIMHAPSHTRHTYSSPRPYIKGRTLGDAAAELRLRLK